MDVFGEIRALAPFRLPGGNRDYLAITSDAGRLVILEYDKAAGAWVKLHQETYGKSGARRAVPGQYLAADPRGRAVMVAALERARLVYTLNRDADAALTISSPLEAHKAQTLTFAIAGLDVGYDNPVFAAIELDCGPSDADPSGVAAAAAQKHLAFYELDLGLNHVVRAGSAPIDNGANLLVSVPGGADGPGGVLVCAENWVMWRGKDTGAAEVRALLPRRAGLPPSRGTLIVASATHRQKTLFFALLQSEYGDIYKVTLTGSGGSGGGSGGGLAGCTGVSDLSIQVFDTLPPSVSLCVLKTGFLFAAADAGNHGLYQFIGIGDDDLDAVVATASGLVETDAGFAPLVFSPTSPPKNLALVDDLDSLAPLLSLQAANLGGEEVPQMYAACGRGPRSSLRVLRPGLAVTELAASPLPAAPTAVFTLRKAPGDALDAYIVVSFANATLVLAVGETVEEVGDTGFNPAVPTLRAQAMADGSFLQIHPSGLRHIKPGGRPPAEWRPPGRRAVTMATSNDRQAALALAGGELVLFELGPDGVLAEVEKRDLGGEVASLDVAPVPEGRARARFLAVGAYDATIRLLSLDPESPLKVLAVQAAGATPESLLLVDSPAAAVGGAPGDAAASGEGAGAGALFLHAGLATGTLLRSEVDPVTGQLSDTRTRFLGTRPPRLFPATVRGHRAMLACSSRPWLGYAARGRHNLAPLACAPLDAAAGFASPQCPEGVCAVSGSTLLILALDRLGAGSAFTQAAARLRYTPRRLVLDAETGALITAEGDVGAVPLAGAAAAAEGGAANGNAAAGELRGPELDEAAAAVAEQVGSARGGAGQWAACVRVLDAASLATRCVLELDGNEAPTSMCLVTFRAASSPVGGAGPAPGGSDAFGQALLAVGTAADLAFRPRRATEGYVRLYRFLDGGRGGLALVHKTALGGIPGALVPFQGRLLAGVGPSLRLLDLGRKKLLRKCEYRSLPTYCVHLSTTGDRVYACDASESAHFLAYRPGDNAFYAFADDTVPRHISASLPLDYDTLATGDKFGNLAILRLPAAVSAAVEADPTGGKFAAAAGVGGGAAPPPAVSGAPNKVEAAVNFHAGDAITGLTRAVLQPGGAEVIVYGTLGGGIAAAVPLPTRADVDFFARLEMHLRTAAPPLAGREHLAYRSHYMPVRNAVDGDLCEQFASLAPESQRTVAAELDRTPGEVLRKLEAMRNVVGQ